VLVLPLVRPTPADADRTGAGVTLR
jgi:hypothetical protein